MISTKENPIDLNSFDDIERLKEEGWSLNSFVRLKCAECQKYFVIKARSLTKEYLCRSCKTKSTCLKKYGVDNPSKSKEVIEKIQNVLKEKYGENYGKMRHKKASETCLKKYGVNHNFKIEGSFQKRIETWKKTIGCSNPFNQKKAKEKSKETYKKNKKEIINKRKQTLKNKYGEGWRKIFAHPKKIVFNNIRFDSKWELKYYLYNKYILKNDIKRNEKSFCYYYNGEKHEYFPDFELDGKLYEIKGDYFFDKNGQLINPYDRTQDEFYLEKQKCILENKVIILKEDDLKEIFNEVEKSGLIQKLNLEEVL